MFIREVGREVKNCAVKVFEVESSLYSVNVVHNCVHIMLTHRHTLTAALCSRLTQKSHFTLVRSHCSCTSHGIVFNASRNLDGTGAWSQTTASGNVPCLSRSRCVVLVISKHGRVAGSQLMELAAKNIVLTQRLGAMEYTNTNSTAIF